MADAGLKITIGADVQQAVAAVKSFAKEVSNTGAIVTESTAQIAPAFESFAGATDNATGSIAELRQIVKSLQQEIIQFDNAAGNPKGLKALTDELALAKNELRQLEAQAGLSGKALGTTVTTGATQANAAMGGFLNTNAKARVAFLDLGRIVTDQGFSLRSLASNFALFPPIVVVAAAAIGGLIYAFTRQTEAQKEAIRIAAEHKKAVEDLIIGFRSSNDIQDAAQASTGGEIVRITELARVVQNVTLSQKERNRALTDLKEINKSYFGDLTLEADKLGLVKKATEEYTQAIIQQAVIKELEGDIGKVGAAYFRQAQIVKNLIDNITHYREVLNNSKASNNFISGNATSDQQALINAIHNTEIALEEQSKTLFPLSKQYEDLKEQIKSAVDISLQFKDLKNPKKDNSVETALNKEIESIKKEIAALEQLQKQGDITRLELEQLFNLKIKLIQVELPKTKLTPEQAGRLITDLQNQAQLALSSKPIDLRISLGRILTGDAFSKNPIDALKKVIDTDKTIKANPLKVDVGFNIPTAIDPAVLSKLRGLIKGGVKVPLTLDLQDTNDIETKLSAIGKIPAFEHFLENAVKTEGFEKGLDKTIALFDDFKSKLKSIAQSVGSLITDSITSIAEGIGQALAGQQNPFSAFLSVIADGLESIGKQMIAAAPVILALKTALKSLNPAILLPAGIALVAVGAALKANISKSTTAFAEGGIVTGPTNALIGERGPEVIFPLRELNKFVKGTGGSQSVTLTPSVQVSGDVFRILLNNVDRRQRRV